MQWAGCNYGSGLKFDAGQVERLLKKEIKEVARL
jgi:hypothetical protein